MALNIEPSSASFPASGGNGIQQDNFEEISLQALKTTTCTIMSTVDTRHAFKVKSSNNDHYRVRPVYGFVAAKGTHKLEVMRLAGPPKEDKLVVQWAEVPEDEADAQAPFKAGAQSGEVILPLKAT
ncbi:hypothetical protein WR25_27055 [Diploscapter pachys]|uniref:Major sperm protein n=1 Tax=Diploscapter pachys TaxID=2018661 RepID=A0A2A2KCN3_9BILA|nr:hypothetical protein WR25_27055 [Diploscapter pachys]